MTVNATTTVDAAIDALYAKLFGDSQLPTVYVGPVQPKGLSWVHISGEYQRIQEPLSSGANNPFHEFYDIDTIVYVEKSSPNAPAAGAWIAARDLARNYVLRIATILHNDQFLSNTVERIFVMEDKRDIGFDDKAQAYQIRHDLKLRVAARVQ